MADTILNGTGALLYRRTGEVGSYAYKAVGHATSHTLNVTMSTRDTSSKDTGNLVSREAGRLDAEGSADGLTLYDDDFGYEDMQLAITAREVIYMIFTSPDAEEEEPSENPDLTGIYAAGSFLLTSVNQNAPDQENADYAITFVGIGDFLMISR